MKMSKNLLIWEMALLAFFLVACSDSTSPKEIELPTLLAEDVDLGDFTVDSLDAAGHKIFATPSQKEPDSFVLGSLAPILESSGGTKVFLAANDDLKDPEIDWGNELFEGTSISVKDTNRVSLVVMNDNNEIVAVWVVELPEAKKEIVQSSSSDEPGSSSEQEMIVPFSSEEKEKLSSSSIEQIAESSSSEELPSSEDVQPESSSSLEASSSSEEKVEESSSSILSNEKNLLRMQVQVDGVTRNDLVIDSDNRIVSLALQSIMDTNKVQILNMKVSTNASYSGITLKSSLELSKVDGNYEYPFLITAEDGSSAEWKMVLTAPPGILLSELKFIYDDNEYDFDIIEDTIPKIYVELDYGADLSKIELKPYGETYDLREGKTFALVDGNGELKRYNLKAGVQLPGSDFSSMDKDFWGTTGIALGTSGTANGTGNIIGSYSITSDPGFVQKEGAISLSSHVIKCSWLGGVVGGGLPGGYKLGTGMYFAGSYVGATATDLYERGYVSGKTPSTDASNILPDMKLGADFSARPRSFTVSYTYKHVDGKNSSYPQKSLIYVMLVGANNKVVAAGYITNDKDTQTTVEIPLEYKTVEGVLSAGFPVDPKLSKGTESEEIVSIHVMFAASAYAFNVAGGAIMGYESEYRGGDGAELIIDDFKLNY